MFKQLWNWPLNSYSVYATMSTHKTNLNIWLNINNKLNIYLHTCIFQFTSFLSHRKPPFKNRFTFTTHFCIKQVKSFWFMQQLRDLWECKNKTKYICMEKVYTYRFVKARRWSCLRLLHSICVPRQLDGIKAPAFI